MIGSARIIKEYKRENSKKNQRKKGSRESCTLRVVGDFVSNYNLFQDVELTRSSRTEKKVKYINN